MSVDCLGWAELIRKSSSGLLTQIFRVAKFLPWEFFKPILSRQIFCHRTTREFHWTKKNQSSGTQGNSLGPNTFLQTFPGRVREPDRPFVPTIKTLTPNSLVFRCFLAGSHVVYTYIKCGDFRAWELHILEFVRTRDTSDSQPWTELFNLIKYSFQEPWPKRPRPVSPVFNRKLNNYQRKVSSER